MTTPTPRQVLDLTLPANDSGETTVRGYLVKLLLTLWTEGEMFSGKYPFGSSDWQYDLYEPLAKAGWVRGSILPDADGVSLNEQGADILIESAIRALGSPA